MNGGRRLHSFGVVLVVVSRMHFRFAGFTPELMGLGGSAFSRNAGRRKNGVTDSFQLDQFLKLQPR